MAISYANSKSAASVPFLDLRVSSSTSTWSKTQAIRFRNDNARFRSKPRLSSLPRDAVSGVMVSGFGPNKRQVAFVKLGRLTGEKRRPGGLPSVRADASVITESEFEGAEKSSEKEIISKLLSLVQGTDRGAVLGKAKQENVANVVGQLERYGIPEPLQSPLIFGDWDVAYSSNPTSPGGGYRSWFGRLIFRTRAMIQTITAPDLVINIVRFALFGFIHGQVILQGKLKPLDKKMIQVDFEPPSIQIGPFKFKYGSFSTVKISITYLDDRIRLGRGSRGTVFVFTRR